MTTPPQIQHSTGRRDEVWRVLRDAGRPMGIAEIADRLGIHANTVRFHLDRLVSNGQVERTTPQSGGPGRPAQLFQSVRGMDPMGLRHYRVLAEVLAASLSGEAEPSRRAVEAGRMWGRQQVAAVTGMADGGEPVDAVEAVGRLMGMLDELGFAPEAPSGPDGSQIGLRNCPFLELAVNRSEVVCPVHLGLMQGAMESWNSPVTVGRLDSFVEPDLCVAHLSAGGVL